MNDTGGYCPKCDTVWVAPGRCNCSNKNKINNVYAREVWNEAIETVAKFCDEMGEEARVSENIKGLKK